MTQVSEVQNINYFEGIIEKSFDEASFLWVLRSVAVGQPQYSQTEIKTLEGRIENHLDALIINPEAAWNACLKGMRMEEAGESFVIAVVAFRSLEVKKIQLAVESGLTNEYTLKGLVSALGWLPEKITGNWIKKFLMSKDLGYKRLALSVFSILRKNPGELLNTLFSRDDCLADKLLYARALRLVGELKRHDLMPALDIAMNSDDPEVLFWSAWSALLLGNHDVIETLRPVVMVEGDNQQHAINMAFRVLSIQDGRAWISELAGQEGQMRNVIKAIAVLGDPHAISWVTQKMKDAPLARLCGEVFTCVTGIDLEENNLVIDLPNLNEQVPESDEVSLSMEDVNLSWPNSEKLAAVWLQHGPNYRVGQRYFLGKSIDEGNLFTVLDSGTQRHRASAALELALINPMQLLVNVKAKVYKGAS